MTLELRIHLKGVERADRSSRAPSYPQSLAVFTSLRLAVGHNLGFPGGSPVKNPPAMQKSQEVEV